MSRDGLDIEAGLGTVTFLSVWVKGDIKLGAGSPMEITEELIQCQSCFYGGKGSSMTCNPGYNCYSLLDELKALDFINAEIKKKGGSFELNSTGLL